MVTLDNFAPSIREGDWDHPLLTRHGILHAGCLSHKFVHLVLSGDRFDPNSYIACPNLACIFRTKLIKLRPGIGTSVAEHACQLAIVIGQAAIWAMAHDACTPEAKGSSGYVQGGPCSQKQALDGLRKSCGYLGNVLALCAEIYCHESYDSIAAYNQESNPNLLVLTTSQVHRFLCAMMGVHQLGAGLLWGWIQDM